MKDSKNIETIAVRTQGKRSDNREHSAAIHATSSFVFEDAEQARAMFADEVPGNIYSRFSNPNCDELVEKVVGMEGAEDGIATASGMAAIFASMAGLLEAGDHVLASRSVFGSTHQILTSILPKWKIGFTYVDIDEPGQWEAAITPETKMIFVETPSNPSLDLIDLEWLGGLARERGLIVNVDNCFATPYLQRPMEYGAHLVTHSATKFMDGQGRVIGGMVVGKRNLLEKIRFFARHTGPCMSPFNAWVLSKSLETLPVRMDRHCENALGLAKWLESRKGVQKVVYPFLPSHPQRELAERQMRAGGGIVTFLLEGGIGRGRKFLDACEGLSFTANLGDTRTIVTHPASTTHSKLTDQERAAVGIQPGTIRVSVGLEHLDDIKTELEKAISRSA